MRTAATAPIATSPTGSVAPAGGFTLFELLIVLAILAIVAAVAVPHSGAFFQAVAAKGAAYSVAAGLRQARGEAIARNTDVAFYFDTVGRRYRVQDLPAHDLPRHVEAKLTVADTELSRDGVGSIRFFPDGSATGGDITLADGRAVYVIRVDWFTGRVALSAADQS